MFWDILKGYIAYQTRFGKCALVICTILFAIWLIVYTASRTWEQKFVCKPDKADALHQKCYSKEQPSYAALLVQGLLLLCVILVQVAYAYGIMGPVKKYRSYSSQNHDVEADHAERIIREKYKNIFRYHILQLVLRFFISIIGFGIPIWMVSPKIYRPFFECTYVNGTKKHYLQSTRPNNTGPPELVIQCNDQLAELKNGLFGTWVIFWFILVVVTSMDFRFLKKKLRTINSVEYVCKCLPWKVDSFEFCRFLVQEMGIANDGEDAGRLLTDNAVDGGSGLGEHNVPPVVKDAIQRHREYIRGQKNDLPYTKLEQYLNNQYWKNNNDTHEIENIFVDPMIYKSNNDNKKQACMGLDDFLNDILKVAAGKHLLLKGKAGVGKTFLTNKLKESLVVGTPEELSPFRFIIHLTRMHIENLSVETFKDILLAGQILQCNSQEDEIEVVINYMNKNSEKVLIIFDADNQYGKLQIDTNYLDISVKTLHELIESRLFLPNATVLCTSRLVGFSSVHCSEAHTTIYEVTGFDDHRIEQFVSKFCNDDANLEDALKQDIFNNPKLYTLCQVPFYCFMVCVFLRSLRSNSLRNPFCLPDSVTMLYCALIKVFMYNHSGKSNDVKEFKDILKMNLKTYVDKINSSISICARLAFKNLSLGNFEFSESDMEIESSGFLENKYEKQTGFAEFEEVFCFSHVTIQEFFSAYHLALEATFEEFTNYVGKHAKESRLSGMFQFVAGLLQWREDKEERHARLQILIEELINKDEGTSKNGSFLTLSCSIYEAKEMVKEEALENHRERISTALPCSLEASKFQVTDDVLAAFAFTVNKFCDNHSQKLKHLILPENNIGERGCKELLGLLPQILVLDLGYNRRVNDECMKAIFMQNHDNVFELQHLYLNGNEKLTNVGINYLMQKVAGGQLKNLELLDLSGITIDNQSSIHLQNGIQSDNSEIKTLILEYCEIDDNLLCNIMKCVKASHPSSLCSLNICYNNITSQGIQHLTSALQEPSCKIDRLYLSHNKLDDDGVMRLAEEVFKTNSFKLDVSHQAVSISDQVKQKLLDGVPCDEVQIEV